MVKLWVIVTVAPAKSVESASVTVSVESTAIDGPLLTKGSAAAGNRHHGCHTSRTKSAAQQRDGSGTKCRCNVESYAGIRLQGAAGAAGGVDDGINGDRAARHDGHIASQLGIARADTNRAAHGADRNVVNVAPQK